MAANRGTGPGLGALTTRAFRPTLAPVLVYVHGIGRQDPAELLHARLDRIVFGGPRPDTRLAYYADVLHGERPPGALARFRAAHRLHRSAMATARTDAADDAATDTAAAETLEQLAQLDATLGGDATGDEAWGRLVAFRERLQRHEDATTSDRPRWVEREAFRLLVGTLLPDVGAYFFGGHAEAMREPLRRILRAPDVRLASPLAIVSHSLGTVVSYHVLSEPEFVDLRVDQWLTLGSPLGIDEIRWLATRGEGHPAPMPPGVRHWTNIADPLDPVALDGTLHDEYGPAERIVELRLTIASRMHHAMKAYLAHERVRALVIESVTPERPEGRPEERPTNRAGSA